MVKSLICRLGLLDVKIGLLMILVSDAGVTMPLMIIYPLFSDRANGLLSLVLLLSVTIVVYVEILLLARLMGQ